MTGALRIGCSSWTSEAWAGRVYPIGLPPAERLAVYARAFDTVEVDASYYRDPGPTLVRRWARVTPPGFVFALKFPRELLDPKRAVDRERTATFVENALALGPKLGPILLQFPPWVRPGRAEPFLRELLAALPAGPRYAVELRDAGWFRDGTVEALGRTLGEAGVALAWSYLTYLDVPPLRTTDYVYLRFIGDHTSVPAPTHGELRVDRAEPTRRWAARVREVRDAVTAIFAFFNNHYAGFAPESANQFRQELGLPPVRYAPGRVGRLETYGAPDGSAPE